MWFTEVERYPAIIPTMAKTLHDSEHESPIHCRSPKNMLFFFGAKDPEFLDVSFSPGRLFHLATAPKVAQMWVISIHAIV
jgi:hypothetical protein